MVGRWRNHYPAYEPPNWWKQAQYNQYRQEQRERYREQELASMTTPNGVKVQAAPLLVAAMQDVKPLPWKWIAFGALVAVMAIWPWLA